MATEAKLIPDPTAPQRFSKEWDLLLGELYLQEEDFSDEHILAFLDEHKSIFG